MKKLPISVCLISGAEAHRIGRALASVSGWTSEIMVVLNEETADGTEEICRQHGAQVFREPWKGHVRQKNSAAEKATQPWILGLDADETVSDRLRDQILRLFAEPARLEAASACSFPRLTWFCGRWIRHGDWYPDRQTRLWRAGRARWGGVDPHDRLVVEGAVLRLKGDLLHNNAERIDAQIAKIGRYSEDFLLNARTTGRSASGLDVYGRPVWRFLRGYFFKGGFLDGWQGWYIAWMTAFYTATRYVKIRAKGEKSAPENHR